MAHCLTTSCQDNIAPSARASSRCVSARCQARPEGPLLPYTNPYPGESAVTRENAYFLVTRRVASAPHAQTRHHLGIALSRPRTARFRYVRFTRTSLSLLRPLVPAVSPLGSRGTRHADAMPPRPNGTRRRRRVTVCAVPFVGPAGRLLDKALDAATSTRARSTAPTPSSTSGSAAAASVASTPSPTAGRSPRANRGCWPSSRCCVRRASSRSARPPDRACSVLRSA